MGTTPSGERPFEPHDQYRVLNGLAHRKPPARVGAPALTKHFAIWIPPEENDVSFSDRREKWIAYIDWFLASLLLTSFDTWRNDAINSNVLGRGPGPKHPSVARFVPTSFNAFEVERGKQDYILSLFRNTAIFEAKNLADPGTVRFKPLPEKGNPLGEDWRNATRFETVSFLFFYDRVPVKMRVELHTEYLSISMSASFDAASKDSVTDYDTQVCSAIKTHFKQVRQVLTKRWNVSCGKLQSQQLPDRKAESRQLHLDTKELSDASRYLFDDFWTGFEDQVIRPALSPTIEGPERVKEHVGSLREKLGRYFADFRGVVLSASIEGDKLDFHNEFEPHPRTSLRDYVRQECIKEENRLDFIHAAMPLIDGARRIVQPSPERDGAHYAVEYTASTTHRGRSLYLSALGPQRPWSEENEPVFFVVFARHRHRWQIGRLIDRLNSAGTLRVASLFDYPSLNDVGFKLRELGRRIDVLARDLGAPHKPDNTSDDPKVRLAGLSREFAEIGLDNDLVKEGGVQYRMERSQFYARQFEKEAEALDIGRIEGFQPYKAFVQRKLGQTWDYIAHLSSRFESIERRLNSLRAEIRLAEGVAQTARLQEQTTKLHSLQKLAEDVSVIPITYYLGYLLTKAGAWVKDHVSSSWAPPEIIYYVAAAAIYIAWLTNKRSAKSKQ